MRKMGKAEAEYSSSGEDRIAVIMPVYNEADSIADTVRELYAKLAGRMSCVDVWVFEDGSVDGTKEVLGKLEDEFANLHVKMTPKRKGYPRAMREAFLAINTDEYQYVVAIDSDGQYEPTDIMRLWNVMQSDSPDIVVGRRM